MSKRLKQFLIALISFIVIATAFILEFALLDITKTWVIVLIVINGVMLLVSAVYTLFALIDIDMY